MSPGIGVAIKVPPFAEQMRGKPPRYQILACLALVRGAGTRFSQREVGVICGRLTGEWVIDRRVHPGVNVAGAVLLAMQPPADDQSDPSATAARAIGVQMAYMVGAEDGWSGEPQNAYWLKGDLTGKHYHAGYLCGVEALSISSVFCAHCGSRRWRGESDSCDGCDK